ncbi:MAG TPA: hypothetical protein VHS81_12370 [Caulobacteraceae bacterium]|nr:hypothetical protein [Caulobacteraceae bacterium]
MAGRLDPAVAHMGAGRPSEARAQPTLLREAGFFENPRVKGPGGLGPVLSGPGRRGRPERPPHQPAIAKWLQRLIRVNSAASGAATLLLLVYQSADPAMSAKVDMTFGLPGAMLIGMFAIVLIALGLGD